MDFMHILGQKEAIWNTIFNIFERRRGPPNVAGPGKTSSPSPPPLDGPAPNRPSLVKMRQLSDRVDVNTVACYRRRYRFLSFSSTTTTSIGFHALALTDSQLTFAMYMCSVSKKPMRFLTFSPNGWEFLVQILLAYYTFLSTLDYNFFYSINCNFDEVMPY